MEDNVPNNEKGFVLIADPYLLDPNFEKTVILITDVSENGAMGFVLNQPTTFEVSDVIKEFPDFKVPLYIGGPVEQDILFYVHTIGDKIDNSIPIANGYYWGGDFNQLKELIEKGEVSQQEVRFFLGYSGWSKEQLEGEFEQGSWTTGEFKKNYLFAKDPKKVWAKALKDNGDKNSLFGDFPYVPSLN